MGGSRDLTNISHHAHRTLKTPARNRRCFGGGLDGHAHPASACRYATIHVTTRQPTEFVDLTDRLERLVADAGFRFGILNVQTLHTTTAVVVNEHEPLLLADFQALLEAAAPGDGRYRHDDMTADREHDRCASGPTAMPTAGRSAAVIGLPQRQARPAACSANGSACSLSSWMARANATSRSSSSARQGNEGQDDPARADGGDQPVLAADQVLAVPAARPGDAGRVPRATTTRSRFRTSTSRRSTSTTRRIWW